MIAAQRQFVERAVVTGQALRGADRILSRDLPREGPAACCREGARLHPRALRADLRRHRPSLDADRRGFTHDEYDRLSRPGGLRFAPVRWLMKGPGRLSRGIDLGWKHGFDSGVMLDYIYQNRAQGLTPLGRLIDRFFLNAIGWRGIRVRRMLLEQALRSLIEQTHAAGRPVRLLDIASGPGRYVLETIRTLHTIPISAVLRDCKQENLDAAARLRDELGLANVTVTHGDAFDRASLASVTPRPTIALVSGLYELFPDNEPVLRSLRGLADAVEPGGHLLYTNQPWHPQVEFIARVLTNGEGQPWIMRRRSQAEMDELVQTAGFEKISQEVDPWGIFTVSVARRVGPDVSGGLDIGIALPLFVVVYGSTNWFTAHRPNADVKTWYFAWEPTVIPYVPLLIVPYMSMDLFFFMARFLMPRRTGNPELRTEGGFSILTAASSFCCCR